MPWDEYDLLPGDEPRGKDLPAGAEQKGPELLYSAPSRFAAKPDPLDYGDPIAYAEAENTYRHRNDDADVIELSR
jgi:hypothetical protein